jgi:SAM-dependent methyltransferase
MSVTDRPGAAARLVRAGNRALDGTFVSPVTRRPIARAAGGTWLATEDGTERYPVLAGDVPDLRPGAVALPAEEVEAVEARLDHLWEHGARGPEAAPAVAPAGPREARGFWRAVARAEAAAYARWWLRGRPAYTQADSMSVYREVTDTYPNARRRRVWVTTGASVGTAPLETFKRLTLEPVLALMRAEGLRSVLDFGCGWGVNTILLRQQAPDAQVWSFDASPYRVLSARYNLERLGLAPYRLFVADGSRLPLPDASVDLVFTTHVLEQMAEVLPGALAEIRRVARRFAVHVEPGTRFARWPHRLRVRRLGYPADIAERARALGWTIREHRPAEPGWGKAPGELIVLAR